MSKATSKASSPARPRVAIRVVRADGGPEAFVTMSGNNLFCGSESELRLEDDPFVAPRQARFYLEAGKLAVEDIGGGNGVFIRLRGEREVRPGGELRVGRQRLRLETIPEPPAPTDEESTDSAEGAEVWGSPAEGAQLRLIQLLDGGVRANAYPLPLGTLEIGREIGAIAFPHDGFLSGRHAQLQCFSDRIQVKDLGSSNGTFARLTAPVQVNDGDHFLIGGQLIRVEVGS